MKTTCSRKKADRFIRLKVASENETSSAKGPAGREKAREAGQAGSRRAVVLNSGCVLEFKNAEVWSCLMPITSDSLVVGCGHWKFFKDPWVVLTGNFINEGLISQGKELSFYSKYDGKPLTDTKQRNEMI